ncbi:MAG TPA: DUF1801 domain-containing protein [Dongiaceae bacterium]
MAAAEQITDYIKSVAGWRGKLLARLRTLVREAAPELAEDWKWNVPVYTHNGNVVALGAFQDHVKVNFFKGASLKDPARLFNAGLEAKATRAIDIHEGAAIDEAAFKALVRAAAALNGGKPPEKKTLKK